jgi:uncharacterized membrane protein
MGNRWDTARLEAFSDGVLAIAITLLVLDIEVPESDFGHMWYGIAHQWPSYLAYTTSFVTIGGIWTAHHAVFRRMRYANQRVMYLNLVLLMAIAFLPFPTRLMAEAIRNPDAERAAVIFYGLTLMTISILSWALWTAVRRERELLHPDVTDEEIQLFTRRATPNIGFYVAATVLALVAPTLTAVVYFAIGAATVLRARGDSGQRRAGQAA